MVHKYKLIRLIGTFLAISIILLVLYACTGQPSSIEAKPIDCPPGEIVTGCAKGADGKTIVFLSEPLPEGAPPLVAGDQSNIVYEVAQWQLMDSPTPTPLILHAPVNIIVLPPEETQPPSETEVPIPTVTPVVPTPTAPPPGTNFIRPGDSGGGEHVGRCTVGLAAYYTNPGSYYGKKFLLTNAHCVVKPHKSGAPFYSCPDCAGKPYLSPAKMDGPKIVGKVAYWYPNRLVDNFYATYDAGAAELNPGNDVINEYDLGIIAGFNGIVPIETKLEAIGATGGYRKVKVVGEDACIYIYGDDGKLVNFCAQYIVQGIKPDDQSSAYKPMQPGDSGTVFVLADGKTSKTAVCLGFAGTSDMKYGVCSPMDLVFKGMHLSLNRPSFLARLLNSFNLKKENNMIDITSIFVSIQTLLVPKLLVLLAIAALDFLFGVALSLIQKRFEWERLTDYLPNSIMPIAGWFAVGLIGLIPQDFVPQQVPMVFESVVYATVFLKIFASFLGHLSAIGILQGSLSQIGISPTGNSKRGLGG
jgi:hypothetical protein